VGVVVVTIQVRFHKWAVMVVEVISKEQRIWGDEGAAVLMEREEMGCQSQVMRAWLVMGAGLLMGEELALLEAGRFGQGVRHGRCR
jgi:hypothetical protein